MDRVLNSLARQFKTAAQVRLNCLPPNAGYFVALLTARHDAHDLAIDCVSQAANYGNAMKYCFAGLLFLPILLGLCAPSSAADGGGNSQPPVPGLENGASPAQAPASILINDMPVMPRENELGPNAQETLAYLVFIKAILDEDEAALLDAASLLSRISVPASVWLDGGVWLMSRKSPNSVVYLEMATKAVPDDLSLNLLHAEALGDHGMAHRGVASMRAYLERHPDALDARLELALLLVKDKNFTEAQKLLGEISPKQRTPLVDYYQARALLGMNRRAEAIPYLRKAVKGMPDFVEALAELAFAYEQEGNLREARSIYEKLQKLNFSPQDVALRLINLSLKLKQPEKALQHIKRGPNSLQFKLAAANMLREAGHYLQAESILKKIAEKGNAPADVYLLLADLVYEQRRNLGMALSWLNNISETDKSASRAALLRCQLLAEAGKNNEAEAGIAAAIKKFPDQSILRDFEIRLLARDKKMPEALAAAKYALEKWPDNTDLAFLYGSLLDENGQRAKAMSVMEDILKKQPDNFQAMNYIGFTLAEQDRELARALDLLQKADELSPDQAYIVDSLAWANFKAGNGAEALKLIRRAVGLGPNVDAAIWEHYGDIAVNQGKRDEARRAYRRALEQKPANAAALRGKLSRL